MSSIKKILSGVILLGAILALAGCGGDDSGGPGGLGTPPVDGGGGGGGTTTAAPSLSIALTDDAGDTITTISSVSPATVKATVRDAAGAAVANTVVTFAVDTAGLVVLTPTSGTALTNASGVATVSLASASFNAAGAATITATTQVGTDAVTGSIGFAVGAASVTMSTPTFGVGVSALSAYGTTSVSVSVYTDGVLVTTPQTVSFTSACAASGKAELTASVPTVDGVATASYRDKGCAGNDTVTASVSGVTTASATLTVTAPTAGSIQFDSVSPADGRINLKGMGGVESALVTFKVVDSSGNPIGGKVVNFSLNTSVGGITITPTTATSDPVTGNVVVSVQAGSIATPVRVSATTASGAATLTTQSSKLVISTGIPDQQNFSVSATELNIEGWDYDGETTVITARVADHFNNPVLDGTAVYFTAEGGSIEPSCTTANGACSVTMTSQALKPNNGRVTVLAYAVGEEGFTDAVVANGLADGIDEMFDANGNSTDMAEAFLDKNENGLRDSNEEYKDFNVNLSYDGADGKYNGVLCDPSVAVGSTDTACNAQKSIHVRRSLTIVFSGSKPVITATGLVVDNTGPNPIIELPPCTPATVDPDTSETIPGAAGAAASFLVSVVDENGNAMPAGTTIKFATTNGKLLSPTDEYVQPSTAKCRTTDVYDCPLTPTGELNAFGNFGIAMKSDATYDKTTGACTNSESDGVFTVKVTTPNKVVTTATAGVTD